MTTTTTDSVYGKAYGGSAPENYQRYFVPVIGGPLAEDLVVEAALRPGERVLDVACGTGVVARLAAARVGPGGTVAALDLNPAMLSVARSVPSAGAAIRWYKTSANRSRCRTRRSTSCCVSWDSNSWWARAPRCEKCAAGWRPAAACS